jgi:hypothetical protein
MGICEVLSAPRSPWQRAYVERVIGSIRRECLDHVIVFHQNSLRRTLHSYFDYYHRSRTHHSLGRTRRSHERFSRRKRDRSWRYRRSVDCTTATNDGPPERARIYPLAPSRKKSFSCRAQRIGELQPREGSGIRVDGTAGDGLTISTYIILKMPGISSGKRPPGPDLSSTCAEE